MAILSDVVLGLGILFGFVGLCCAFLVLTAIWLAKRQE